MRHLETIIVHSSATFPDQDIGVKEIRRWHVEENGWSDIGYHYVIRRDGTLEEGRPIARPGAHTRGFNDHSIGICLVGGLADSGPDFNYTYRQLHRLYVLCRDLIELYPTIEHVKGHRDFDDGKACPCFDAWELIYG